MAMIDLVLVTPFFSQDDEGPASTHQWKVLVYNANFIALLLQHTGHKRSCVDNSGEWDPAELPPKFLR